MAVDTNFASSLFENLKLEDPWLPPTTWETIPSESGNSHLLTPNSSSSHSLYHASTVSEASLVRLAMNALQGVESSLVSIQKLSAAFRSDPADRTFHQIPNLWNRSSSTHALGNILQLIGCSGLLVFLLRKFVDYFTALNVESQDHVGGEAQVKQCPPYSLINHAFAVAVGKVVEGYMCAVDTLYASVGLRRSSCTSSAVVGCLNSVVYSELTLLELYLHTKELRTHIEVLTNVCNLYQFSGCFSESSLEELIGKATFEFGNFYRGGDLLTYLYTQLQVADPAHRPLLKFIFLRTCEPYCGFIRSWIFKAEISDPYKEFVVEYVDSIFPNPHGQAGVSTDFPLATIREQDRVTVPCFLKDFLNPLVRAGQQLQVLVKLLELCTFVATKGHTYEGFLPCWSGFSGNCPSYASPLTFSKGNIEAMILSRNSYYKRMQEKLDNILTKLQFRYQEVVPQGTLPAFLDNGGRSSTIPVLFTLDDNFIPSLTEDEKGPNVACDMDSDELSATESLYELADTYESSECSTSSICDEQNMPEQMIALPNHTDGLEQKYLSALSFSMSIHVDNFDKPRGYEDSCHIVNDQSRFCEKRDALAYSHHKGTFTSQISVPIKLEESNWSSKSDVQLADCLSDNDLPESGLFESYSAIEKEYKDGPRSHPMDSASKVNKKIIEGLKEGTSYFRKRIGTDDDLLEAAPGKDQPRNNTYASSDLFTLPQWKVNSHNNFLSMNPMLTKTNLLNLVTKPGERYKTDFAESLPYFDFSLINDPFKVCLEKLPAGLGDSSTSATSVRSDHHGKQCYRRDNVLIDKTKVSFPFSKDHNQEDANLTNVSGGSCWESLLGRFSDSVVNRVEDHRESLEEIFEIPLDFIIDKCLLQEIMLQYKYISKLTIKLLEEGFDLQEHLLALRRYHFMELADWADLFIMSLWHHKWRVTEADHRLSEIQGFLESSVQRSSCERDPHKDRLFVYMKGHDAMPLSEAAIGVHSFNFLGLGYRVDWPISIILSSGALRIYAEIFSFLIQVKLAISSLTDVWRPLKDLVHLISQNKQSEQHGSEVCHFNALMKMRHQVNHFVSTLQQYVESQLSHVSWCRFLYSLKHKVKDMMDLQFVHMEYLTDSLDICFLSEETRPIARNIGSILQCALDLRSCLSGGMRDVGTGQGNLVATLSGINISQVIAIKQTFDKNLKELHLCYLKSPKHGKFGLYHFWEYLNYNKYYSDVDNEMPY